MSAVHICSLKDAACVDVHLGLRCSNCPAHAAPAQYHVGVQPEPAKLAMNFTPFYIMSNVRRIVPKIYNERSANWVLAMDVFAVGSRTARQICIEAGIDPDGLTMQKVSIGASHV